MMARWPMVIDIRKGIKEIETGAGKLSIASASYRPFSPFEFAKKKATTRKMKRRGGRKNLVKLPRLLAESCRHDRLFFSLSFHAGGKLDPRIYICTSSWSAVTVKEKHEKASPEI